MKASKLSDPDVRRVLCEAISRGMTWKMAAQHARVAESTLHEWRRVGRESTEGPEFELVQALEQAEAECVSQALARIEASSKKSWQAAAWLLERRYGYVARTEISGPDGGPISLAPAQAQVREALDHPEARVLLLQAQKALTDGAA